MFSSRDNLSETWKSLSGRWVYLLLVVWVALICQSIPAAIPKVGGLISLILSGPFYVGLSAFALEFHRNKALDWEPLLQGFDNPFREARAFLMVGGLVVLGFFLLVIPGILWMLSYSQTFFVLSDHPEYTATEAMRKSREIMVGHKLDLVKLHCWQSGLFLLSALTLFVALIWLIPYFLLSWARFYEGVKSTTSVVSA